MEKDDDLSTFAFAALRVRISKTMPAQIRTCVEQLSEEQLWWRANERSNSVGNLVLHVRGAVLHFLCGRIGGHTYERDRPAEFNIAAMSKAQLLAMLDEMVALTDRTFAAMDAARLTDPSTEPAYYSTVFEDLFGVAIHMATHMGQIVYVTKLLNENSINDLWSKTHKATGAWRG